MEKHDFMTSRDVADYCGFSQSIVDKLEREGKLLPRRRLPPKRNGVSPKRLYLKEDVDAYLDTIRTARFSSN